MGEYGLGGIDGFAVRGVVFEQRAQRREIVGHGLVLQERHRPACRCSGGKFALHHLVAERRPGEHPGRADPCVSIARRQDERWRARIARLVSEPFQIASQERDLRWGKPVRRGVEVKPLLHPAPRAQLNIQKARVIPPVGEIEPTEQVIELLVLFSCSGAQFCAQLGCSGAPCRHSRIPLQTQV